MHGRGPSNEMSHHVDTAKEDYDNIALAINIAVKGVYILYITMEHLVSNALGLEVVCNS